MKPQLREEFGNGLKILVGILIGVMGYRMYLIPNNVAPGGFTGIGQLVSELTHGGISVGTVALVLNIPLFALSLREMGIRYSARSLISSILFSLALDYLPFGSVTDDVLLSAVFGGILNGVGFGLILRGNATTGGTDMLAALIHRRFPIIKISVGVFSVDAIVIVASGFVFDPSAAMYALIAAFLMNVVLDYVLEGPNSAHSYIVITTEHEAIAQEVMRKLNRGVTAFDAKGMYSGEPRTVLLCVVNRFESMRLRSIVFRHDPRAFVIASNVREVLGEGFKSHEK